MKKGFTIIEVLVVLTILITLMGIGYLSVLGIERRTPVTTTENAVIADLRGQQTKAMTGDTQMGSSPDYFGVHFQTNAYVLFKGAGYNANDVSNAVTPLPDNVTISTSLPDGNVIFAKGSGEVTGYSSIANTFTVTQTLTGDHKVITINRYGAVTQIQ